LAIEAKATARVHADHLRGMRELAREPVGPFSSVMPEQPGERLHSFDDGLLLHQ
jgi:hypothetical protein